MLTKEQYNALSEPLRELIDSLESRGHRVTQDVGHIEIVEAEAPEGGRTLIGLILPRPRIEDDQFMIIGIFTKTDGKRDLIVKTAHSDVAAAEITNFVVEAVLDGAYGHPRRPVGGDAA